MKETDPWKTYVQIDTQILFKETGCDVGSLIAFIWPRIGTDCRTLVNKLINFLVQENDFLD
jgi:hypothetical protein